MSDSVRPHRQQPTRLSQPRQSPGKNTGVGCHFLLQRKKGKSESEVAQSCPTLGYLMDFSLPGSSIHGIFQSRVLEWGAIALSLSLSLSLYIYIYIYIYIFDICVCVYICVCFIYMCVCVCVCVCVYVIYEGTKSSLVND